MGKRKRNENRGNNCSIEKGVVLRVLLLALSFLGLFTLIFGSDSNLTCQYRYNTSIEVENLNVYDNATHQFITNTIVPQDFIEGRQADCGFKIYNNYDVPLTMRVIFKSTYGTADENITIPPRDFKTYATHSGQEYCTIDRNSIKLIFKGNNETYARYEKQNITTEHCKICDGNICLDDGAVCANSTSCGGGFCTRNRCTPNRNCYLNNCECGEALQCGNDSCVPKRAIVFSYKTSCNLSEECATGWMDEDNSCIKSSAQIAAEQAQKTAEDEAKAKVKQEAAQNASAQAVAKAAQDDEAKAKERAASDRDLMNKLMVMFVIVFFGGIIFAVIVIFAFLKWKEIEKDKIIAETEQKQKELDSLNEKIDRQITEYNLAQLEMKKETNKVLMEREKRLKEIRGLESAKRKKIDEIAGLNQRLQDLTKKVSIEEFEASVKDKCVLSTKKGENVQSKGEKAIADFLFDHNIDYVYDMQITLSGGTEKRWARPDFYLSGFNVIIEYWGMKGDPTYDRKMNDKKRLYAESKTRYVSIERDDLNQIDDVLKTKLNQVGINIE